MIAVIVGSVILGFCLRNRFQGQSVAYGCSECNVVLITMTNLRYDHVSSNGYSRLTTPNIDELAKESWVFDNAFSHASWTLPESMTLYTSQYAFQHGIMNRYDGSALPARITTLVDILKNNKYQTAAFTGGFDYNPEFGLTSRFDKYDECAKGEAEVYPRQRGPVSGGPADYGELACSVPKAMNWLKENNASKFYLHVQGFDAHCPFSQKGGKMFDPDYKGKVDYSGCLWTFDETQSQTKDGEPQYYIYNSKGNSDEGTNRTWMKQRDIEHLVALYDESIYDADAEIGKLITEIKARGLWDKTIVIVTSEHGDVFGKNGRFMRGGPLRGTFYDDVLHVPLIIHVPGIEPKRIEGLVGQVDFMPTLLDLLRLPTVPGAEGKSLLSMIKTGMPINDYIYAGSVYSPDPLNDYYNKKSSVEVVRGLDWKLIRETMYQQGEDGSKLSGQEIETILNDKEKAMKWRAKFSQDKNMKVASMSAKLFHISSDKEELVNVVSENPEIFKNISEVLDKWSRRVWKQ